MQTFQGKGWAELVVVVGEWGGGSSRWRRTGWVIGPDSAFMSSCSLVSPTQNGLLLISSHFMLCPVTSCWAHRAHRKHLNDLGQIISFANQWLLPFSSGCLLLGAVGCVCGVVCAHHWASSPGEDSCLSFISAVATKCPDQKFTEGWAYLSS